MSDVSAMAIPSRRSSFSGLYAKNAFIEAVRLSEKQKKERREEECQIGSSALKQKQCSSRC